MLDDPFGIDRRLGEAARAWLAWRQALRRGAGADHRFERLGGFASATLVRELREASSVDPLAPALARWAHRLHLEHATRELTVARERAYRNERHALSSPSGQFTLRELLDGILDGTRGTRRAYLDGLGAHAAAAADYELRRWERRVELSNALGDASPDVVELPADDLDARALGFLEQTDDALAALGARDGASLVEAALGRGGAASWPSRLTARSLAGLFDEARWLDHVAPNVEELPRAFGASSFLRGLASFGAALRTALAPTSLPFAVAHDPFDLPGTTFGALLALVPLGRSFAARKLGVPRAGFDDHRRVLSRALLVGARVLALRVSSRTATLAGARRLREAHTELVPRALGIELDRRTAGVLVRSRVADPQRLAGLFIAAEQAVRLEQVHDEDWYRNPRAVEELRETARQSAPTNASETILERGSIELARLLGIAV
ncbi:MAG TPA: hypothetical protein VF103_09165 [Polyangiaceae bacterium]